MTSPLLKPNPELDLVLERDVDVPVELVWKAWTTPSHVRHWFVPKPWTVTSCEIDRIASNLAQIAKHANMGTLAFDENLKTDINQACAELRALRILLMRALGKEPPRQNLAPTFNAAASWTERP